MKIKPRLTVNKLVDDTDQDLDSAIERERCIEAIESRSPLRD